MSESAFLGLCCSRCGSEFDRERYFEGCPRCRDGDWAANLEAVYDFAKAKRKWHQRRGRGVWRYASLLPVLDRSLRVTLGEGSTPLLSVPGLQGIRNLWIKNESANPTWSYKDRMCAVGVSVARELGAQVVAISSTGNQAGSGSAYAARAGVTAVVLTLAHIEDPTLAFMQVYGGLVLRTTRARRWELLRHGVHELQWFPISSYTPSPTGNPYAVEGYKTIAYEIFEDLGGAPDVVAVPSSIGEGFAGVYAGFRDLLRMGLAERVPQMVAAEPAGGAPLFKTLAEGAERVVRVEPYSTIATTLAATGATDRALLAIRESSGTSVPVTDEELRDAQTALISSGLFAEAAGAAAVATLSHLPGSLSGFDPENSRVVALMTGSGLRELPALRKSLPTLEVVEPTTTDLERIFRQWSTGHGVVGREAIRQE